MHPRRTKSRACAGGSCGTRRAAARGRAPTYAPILIWRRSAVAAEWLGCAEPAMSLSHVANYVLLVAACCILNGLHSAVVARSGSAEPGSR